MSQVASPIPDVEITEEERRRPGRFEVEPALLSLLRDPIGQDVDDGCSAVPAELSQILQSARAGDIIQVWKLDHLPCSTRTLLNALVELDARGVTVAFWPAA